MSIQRRIDQVIRHLQRPDPETSAVAQANDLIETFVAMDLLHVELGHELPSDSRQLLDHVATLWQKYASDSGVPNDGSAERRIISLCRGVLTGCTTTAPRGGLVARLYQARHDQK